MIAKCWLRDTARLGCQSWRREPTAGKTVLGRMFLQLGRAGQVPWRVGGPGQQQAQVSPLGAERCPAPGTSACCLSSPSRSKSRARPRGSGRHLRDGRSTWPRPGPGRVRAGEPAPRGQARRRHRDLTLYRVRRTGRGWGSRGVGTGPGSPDCPMQVAARPGLGHRACAAAALPVLCAPARATAGLAHGAQPAAAGRLFWQL